MNFYNEMPLFIYLLFEEDFRRNYMRVHRKRLRDTQDPFDMPDHSFLKYYRLSKTIMLDLINALEPHMSTPGNTSGISNPLKFLATLYFLANGSYQFPVGNSNMHCMSQSCVSRAISEVCRLITVHLMPEYIKFPTTIEEKNRTKLGFYEKWNLPGIIGAIDGTHVRIIAPKKTNVEQPPFVYFNRKNSINVMVISDAHNRILAVDARYPGSVHDAAIWQMSNIRNHLRAQYIDNIDRNSHLIGDKGYGLEPWLFTPISDYEEGTAEERFTLMLTSARNVVERTIVILKSRFRSLLGHRVLHYDHEKAPDIIYSACVLHNIAINAKLNIDYVEMDREILDLNLNQNNHQEINVNVHDVGTEARNNYIALYV